jgi:tetratricopeptide (TPR) repeat protein
MRKLWSFLLLASIGTAYGQMNSSLDSVKSLIQNYQYQSALEVINRILPSQDNQAELIYLKGLALKGSVKYTEAIKLFSNLLAIRPNHVTGMIELANCFKMIGDFKHALSYLLLADSLSPNAFIKTERANILFSIDQYDKSAGIFKILLNKDSSNIFLLRSLGRCYDNLGMNDSAIFFYQKTLRINPYDFHSAYRICNIYLRTKAYQSGIDITEKYRAFDSTDVRINRMNAYLYMLKKDYRSSISLFRHCLESKDTSEFVNKYLGISNYKLSIYDTAKIFLERAFLKDTTDAQICNFLGISCTQSFWKKLGIDYLKRAIKLTNPDPVYLAGIYTNLAEACNGFYKYEDALTAFLKAYELNPNDTLLLYRLGVQYDRWVINKELALKFYRQFLKTRPPSEDVATKNNSGLLVVSYYSAVDARIKELEKEMKK